MDQRQQSRWRPTIRQVLAAVGFVIALAVLIRLIRLGYAHPWTGFGKAKVIGEVQPYKTLWDWLDLLIVPVVLAIGGYLFTRSENQRTRQSSKEQTDLDREIADQRAKTDRDIADQRRQDDALQAYLDNIGALLLDKEKPLRQSEEGDDVRTLARARTLTVLRRLDRDRKGRVLQFLYASDLILKSRLVLSLKGANLGEADLLGADLSGANLSSAGLSEVNLSEAYLSETNLSGATLIKAILSKGKLYKADLSGAKLSGTTLRGAHLSRADLSKADLNKATLRATDLTSAKLNEANLSGVDLNGAEGVTEEQLATTESLKDATMPNGQKYEEWLKDKEGRGEDGENAGPS